MSPEDVARLAQAIAQANGSPEAADWAAKVVDAWKALAPAASAPADTRSDLKASVRAAREET